MTAFDELLQSITGDNNLEKMQKICDTITSEEVPGMENPHLIVKGSNILLCLEVPGRTQKEIGFLALEREMKDKYIAVLWTYQKAQVHLGLMGKSEAMAAEHAISPRRSRVWKIDENEPKKILTEYAKIIKYLKGE